MDLINGTEMMMSSRSKQQQQQDALTDMADQGYAKQDAGRE